MKFYYLNTCYSGPEQYDVYRENGEICGYVRLRWGTLYAEYPNIDGEVIYSCNFNDNFKGIFDEDERDYYLNEISLAYKDKILDGIKNNISDNDVIYEILTDPSQLEERLKNE